jgi:hypothetical protein
MKLATRKYSQELLNLVTTGIVLYIFSFVSVDSQIIVGKMNIFTRRAQQDPETSCQ